MPDILSRLKGNEAELPGGGNPSPAAAPMSIPQKKDGKEEQGFMRVHIAMNQLEQAIHAFGAESDKGQLLLDSLKKLGKTFGENDTSDLIPAEMANIVSSMPDVGGGTPQQKALMAQMQKPPQPAQFPPRPAPMPMPGNPQMQGA